MRTELPEGLAVSFLVAVTELGWATAARIFVEEIAAVSGDDAIDAARDLLGRQFSVLDSVASHWLEHGAVPRLDERQVLAELEGAGRVLVVGVEADAIDRLVPALAHVPIGIVAGGGGIEEDLGRVVANYAGRIEIVPIGDWARWAGAKSALVTFVYGADDRVANVSPAYLRLVGPDVRSSFRSLVGWNLLGARPRLHPVYLAETSITDFSVVIGPVEDA